MHLVVALLVSGAAFQAAPAPSIPAACDLLDAADIQAVQGTTLDARRPSEEAGRALRFGQCFFAASDLPRSVSVTVITDRAGEGPAARKYWAQTFHVPAAGEPDATTAGGRNKAAPRPVTGIGDEAFWTGDARVGALYVLSGDVVLRISVGGASSEEERIRRSTALARAALQRFRRA